MGMQISYGVHIELPSQDSVRIINKITEKFKNGLEF